MVYFRISKSVCGNLNILICIFDVFLNVGSDVSIPNE